MGTYAAFSEPSEPPIRGWYCANCGALFMASLEALPDICPACQDLTTWQASKPRPRIPWRKTAGPIEPHEKPIAGVRVYDVGWLASIDKPEGD